jgi:hypothetical protein
MLFQKLQKKDPNITLMLTARAADGYWKVNPKQYLDKASNFVYTDINELKTPEWHKEDWNNNSCRPLGVV